MYSGVSSANPVDAFGRAGDAGGSSHTSPAVSASSGDYVVTWWTDKSPAVAAWTLAFTVVAYLALRDGGYDTVVRSEVAVALWWIVLLAALAGILPARIGRAGWVAIGLLLLRSLIVSMDQPARQAYVVSIVPPNERSGALAVTGAVRGVALAAGPAVTGIAIQAAALGLPFFAGGGVKILYDLALWAGFRRRFGDHEGAEKV